MVAKAISGAVPSPNIWKHPDVYEIENRAMDPAGRLREAVRRLRPLTGGTVLDIGCGTGFHLPEFATTARSVIGVEPHKHNAARAQARAASLSHVDVRVGVAQALPVADASVDFAHARLSYFFGPGCENGLAEIQRVMRRGGTAAIIDNDATRSTFGRWFRRFLPRYDPAAVERFWTQHGFSRTSVDMGMTFDDRADFEAVLRIEFPANLVTEFLAEQPGTTVDYAINIWHRQY